MSTYIKINKTLHIVLCFTRVSSEGSITNIVHESSPVNAPNWAAVLFMSFCAPLSAPASKRTFVVSSEPEKYN